MTKGACGLGRGSLDLSQGPFLKIHLLVNAASLKTLYLHGLAVISVSYLG